MALTPLNLALCIGWFGMPIVCAVVLQTVGGRYILQDGGRWAVWAIVAGAAWLGVTLALPGLATLLRSPKAIAALALWAMLTGYYAGLLAIRLVNCVADSSEAQQASIAKADSSQRMLTVITISDPSPGVTFSVPRTTWLEGEAGGKRFFVHRGRLGLLWGELR